MSVGQSLRQFRKRMTYSPVFIRFVAWLAVRFYRLYLKTLKIQQVFHPDFWEIRSQPFLYGFWHGRQFLLVPTYGDWNVTLMADLSWAGSIQAIILQTFGYTVVRGSSKRKGVQALLDMKQCLEQGKSGAFALDGPSGPIYQSKPGMLFLAKKMRLSVVPLTSSASNAWIFENTWCRYMVPKPFSRCITAVGKPIFETDGLDEKAFDAILMSFMKEVDQQVGWQEKCSNDSPAPVEG